MKDLKTKIEIILNEEERTQSLRSKLGSFNIDLTGGWTRMGEVPPLLSDIPSKDFIRSPNADLLIKLYLASPKEQQEEFRKVLLNLLTPGDYWQVAYLVFFVLYRIGLLIPSVEKTKLSFTGNIVIHKVYGMLSKIIYFEYPFIAEETYTELKQILNYENNIPYVQEIKERINAAEVRIIEKELEGFNQEVNEDKEKVITIWQEKFKNKTVPLVINEIEDSFSSGEFNESKYATSIDRVRALMGEVCRGLAIEQSEAKNDNKINKGTKEHYVFKYLKDVGILDLKEFNLLNTIYGIASDKGSHQVVALREHARLIKNIAYEFLLLLLNKSNLN